MAGVAKACRIWYLKPASIAIATILPMAAAVYLGLEDAVFAGLVAVYWVLGAIVYRVSSSFIAGFSVLSLPLYLWPPGDGTPVNPSVYAALSLLAAVSARVFARPRIEGPYIDPSIEAVVLAGRFSPAALATAVGFSAALWLGFPPPKVSLPPWLALVSAAAASIMLSPFSTGRLSGVVLGLASIFGPASLLVSSLAASFKPYCYSCPGRRIEGDLVLAIARTWPTRGLEVLADGRVVACAAGEPRVGERSFTAKDQYETLEGEGWTVKKILKMGGELVYHGCRGEVLVVAPRNTNSGVKELNRPEAYPP